jgi:hypothetical protein
MKNLFKNLFGKKEQPTNPKESKEPWVNVVSTDFDENNPRQGFMELEWNAAFIQFLRSHGYEGKTDEELVDKWFTELCKNIGAQFDEENKFVANADVLPKRRKKVDKNNQ